jgi:hypothetical protein
MEVAVLISLPPGWSLLAVFSSNSSRTVKIRGRTVNFYAILAG